MQDKASCFAFLTASGALQAAFALPIRYLRGWHWEQMWVAQSLTANLLFPLAWAALLPPSVWTAAALLPASHWVRDYAFGIVWGLGGLGYGLTLTRLGLSFAYSFVFGITTLSGAVLPLVLEMVEEPAHPFRFTFALVACLAATFAISRLRQESAGTALLPMPLRLNSYATALGLAAMAGIFSAAYGMAFSVAVHDVRSLTDRGIAAAHAPWIVALALNLGSASVAVPVGLFAAFRRRTMPLFSNGCAPRNWALALLMGFCATAGTIAYGVGSAAPGHPQPNVAFGVFMTCFVFSGNAIGFAQGELRSLSRARQRGVLAGIALLIGAAWLLQFA